ncbi:MAG: hypothetical protein WBI71_02115 [Methanothermobacter tenebrarum]
MAGLVMLVVGMLYYQPVNAEASPSATQTLKAEVEPTVAIAAEWAREGNNSTIILSDLAADNMERSWPGGDDGEQVHSYSNVPIDLYVRANGDLTNDSNTISLDLLKYANYGASVPKTSFTTEYVMVLESWGPPSQGEQLTVPVDLYLTVPFATPPRVYTTIIYHAAVQENGEQPTSP